MRFLLLLAILVPLASQAEVVAVKGAGDVDLSAFDCTSISESRLLNRVCYDETHRYLIAQIGEDYYETCNVGSKAVDGLMDSEHVVAYYNQRIRAQHKCTAELRKKTGIVTLGAAAH